MDTENSLVTVCVDFIKGKCARETCKYFHPPEHLVNQLKKQKITNNAAAAAAAAALATNNLTIIPSIGQASFGLHPLYSPNQFVNTNFSNQYRQLQQPNHHHFTSNQYTNSHSYHGQRSLGNTNDSFNKEISYYSLPIYNSSALAAANFTASVNNKFNNAVSNVASNLNLMPADVLNTNFQFTIQPSTSTTMTPSSQQQYSASDSNFRNNNNNSNNNILLRASTAASLIGSAQQTNTYNAQLSVALAAAAAGTNLV